MNFFLPNCHAKFECIILLFFILWHRLLVVSHGHVLDVRQTKKSNKSSIENKRSEEIETENLSVKHETSALANGHRISNIQFQSLPDGFMSDVEISI